MISIGELPLNPRCIGHDHLLPNLPAYFIEYYANIAVRGNEHVGYSIVITASSGVNLQGTCYAALYAVMATAG